MLVWKELGVREGVLSVIGSGGKTTLLATLARELPGSVILCTTTHMLPFPGIPLLPGDEIQPVREILLRERVVCLGRPDEKGKLTVPALLVSQLQTLAPWVLVEADGSKHLPLKAHAPYEPVIPPESQHTILVVGASGFGRPILQVVHRPERFCALTGASPEDLVTPELAARAIAREGLARQVLLNQVEEREGWAAAQAFARALEGSGIGVWAGSLRRGLCRRA